MKTRLWKKLLRFLQSFCDHPPNHVTADVLDGDYPDEQIHHCRICGAVKRGNSEWREPRPDWTC